MELVAPGEEKRMNGKKLKVEVEVEAEGTIFKGGLHSTVLQWNLVSML